MGEKLLAQLWRGCQHMGPPPQPARVSFSPCHQGAPVRRPSGPPVKARVLCPMYGPETFSRGQPPGGRVSTLWLTGPNTPLSPKETCSLLVREPQTGQQGHPNPTRTGTHSRVVVVSRVPVESGSPAVPLPSGLTKHLPKAPDPVRQSTGCGLQSGPGSASWTILGGQWIPQSESRQPAGDRHIPTQVCLGPSRGTARRPAAGEALARSLAACQGRMAGNFAPIKIPHLGSH